MSRDGDFGAQFGSNSYLNDRLRREFKDRVLSKRKIELTTKLTDALKKLDEVVTKEDEEAEEKLIGEEFNIRLADLFRNMGRSAASRLLNPDPTIEAYLKHQLNNQEGSDP